MRKYAVELRREAADDGRGYALECVFELSLIVLREYTYTLVGTSGIGGML